MRVVALAHEHAEKLSEFLGARAVSYRRTQGKWADLFEWDCPIDVSASVPSLRSILVDSDKDGLEIGEEEAKKMHREVLNLLDEAEEAERQNRPDAARLFYETAYDCARTAAEGFVTALATVCEGREDAECRKYKQLRSLLYASAVDLAIKVGRPHEATRLIESGPDSSSPLAVASEPQARPGRPMKVLLVGQYTGRLPGWDKLLARENVEFSTDRAEARDQVVALARKAREMGAEALIFQRVTNVLAVVLSDFRRSLFGEQHSLERRLGVRVGVLVMRFKFSPGIVAKEFTFATPPGETHAPINSQWVPELVRSLHSEAKVTVFPRGPLTDVVRVEVKTTQPYMPDYIEWL